ncbi:MAG TPA: hypothetical protein VFS55_05160 [Dokdonella sp.]|nr:hypothetical protein [Dokdonella sp.]
MALIFADTTTTTVDGAWRDGASSRFTEATLDLRLLDEERTDDLRKILVRT